MQSGVVFYINDILVTGKTPEEHLHNLDQVMHRLEEAGATLEKSKCTFAAQSVEYLGHIIYNIISYINLGHIIYKL